MSYDLDVILANGDRIQYEDVEEFSFIDANSHGKPEKLGITPEMEGEKLLICSSNVAAVLVSPLEDDPNAD